MKSVDKGSCLHWVRFRVNVNEKVVLLREMNVQSLNWTLIITEFCCVTFETYQGFFILKKKEPKAGCIQFTTPVLNKHCHVQYLLQSY